MRAFSLKARIAVAGIAAAAAVLGFSCSGSATETQTATINVSASVAQNCSITTTPNASLATALADALVGAGSQSIPVGTVSQTCNKKAGYTLTVSSATCDATSVGTVTATTGAKLVNTTGEEYQLYSVGFTNPSGTNPTGLLASNCTAATGRDVTGSKVSAQDSTISINFTTGVNGVNGNIAGAGTFSDTLTINMSVK